MALSDKNILITPNKGQSADPKIEFVGANGTLGPQTITLRVYPTSSGTISLEGSAGQLFSVTNTLTGTIYSVNDVSGIPSIEVLDTGLVKFAQYSGNVLIGTGIDYGNGKVQLQGSFRAGSGWNTSPASTLFSHTLSAVSGAGNRVVNFDGNGNTPSVWWTNGSRAYGAIDAQDPGLTFWANNGSSWQKQITLGYGTVNIDTTLQQGGNQVLHAGNYSSYAVPLTGGTMTGRLTTTAWTTSARNYSNEWIEFPNHSGLYSGLNNAHFYPSNGSYGSWRSAGSRGGWAGIEFDASNGNVSLMIDPGSNTSGFHNNNYGWQWRWNDGTAYVHKNSFGGGTAAVVLDSSNYTNYTTGIFLRAAGHPGYGDWNTFGNTQQTVHEIYQENFNAGSNTGSSNFPGSRGYNYGTLINFGANNSARAQMYISHSGNDLIFRGGWGTSSWQTWNKVLTDQIYNSYSPTLTGGGASGTWGISITGSAGSVSSVAASAITGQTGMWTSAARPGPYRLYRRDDDSNYSVQTYWTGSYWRLYGYSGDTGHADTHVGYADNSGYATSAGTAGQIDGIEFRNGDSSNGTGPDNITNNGTGYVTSVSLFGQTDGAIYSQAHSSSWVHQIYGDYRTGQLAVRGRNSGTWQSWRAILDATNYNSYSPTLTGGGASGTWGINITGTATDPSKVPLTGGTMTGTLFINSKLRVNTASGPSDNAYGTATDIPMYMSGSTRTQSTFLIENNVNSSIEYPVIVIRRTLTPVGSRFGGMIRFADKNSSGTEISSQIYSFNRLTSQDLFLDAGSGTNDRVVLRAGSSSSMQVAETFIMNVKAVIYTYSGFTSSLDIDCREGNYFTRTISSDSTFTFSNVPTASGFNVAHSFTLELTHTSGTVTWPASVKWPGNIAPTLTTGKTHLFMFVTDDAGSRWRGSYLTNYDN